MSARPAPVHGNRGSVAPARRVAYRVIRRVFEHGAYADRALRPHLAELDQRDRALATALVFGTVQRRGTLDHILTRFSRRPLGRLDPSVLVALRLGLFQLLFLDRVAAHAAVAESVELVKLAGNRGGAQLVNAVLRRASREGPAILNGLGEETPEQAALRHSVPRWLAEMWWEEIGPVQARRLLAAVNAPAEAALRVNALQTTREAILARLPVPARAAAELPEAVVLEAPFDAHGSELFAQGLVMPQSRASMMVARALGPRPRHRVLDLCAAPGGKTTHLAALMGDEGEIVAVERHPGRARSLAQTAERMHARCVRVRVADAASFRDGRGFDRVLVDPPCSGLGTLQSRPDLRWRVRPEAVAELASVQTRILAAGAAATAPGGVLVYSVCTISRREGEGVVEDFLARHDEFALEAIPPLPDGWRQLRPDRDGTDGFYLARLRRAGRP